MGNIGEYELHSLKIAFQLIPPKTDNEDHKSIVEIVISSFAQTIFLDSKDKNIDYETKRGFLETYAKFVLNSRKDDIRHLLKPIVDRLNTSATVADLFQEFIDAEEYLNTYDKFWVVWNTLKDKVIEICQDDDKGWYTAKIVKGYLFALSPWKDTAKEWHSLKEKDKKFFRKISQEIGHCPSAIYAISKLLYGIGSQYINDGVIWISNMLENNKELANAELERNTIFYIENLVRKYSYTNREKIKKTNSLKERILIILDFLIERGSVIGYMLRERII